MKASVREELANKGIADDPQVFAHTLRASAKKPLGRPRVNRAFRHLCEFGGLSHRKNRREFRGPSRVGEKCFEPTRYSVLVILARHGIDPVSWIEGAAYMRPLHS
jgi:hypothetical protein